MSITSSVYISVSICSSISQEQPTQITIIVQVAGRLIATSEISIVKYIQVDATKCTYRGFESRATSQLLKLRFHCDWHIFISFVFPQFTSFNSVFHSFHGLMNSINWPASSVWVFIAQLVEHSSANAEATGSNPVEAPKNVFSWLLQIFNSFTVFLQFT